MMAIELQKKVEKVNIILTKKKVTNACVRVGAAFDVSGSMQDDYRSGTVQDAVDRIFALAYRFDDNGELENWIFSQQAWQIGPVNKDNIDGFVKREVIDAKISGMWQGTNYAPALNLIAKYYSNIEEKTKEVVKTKIVDIIPTGFMGKVKQLFGAKKTEEVSYTQTEKYEEVTPSAEIEYPGYLIFITDGENDDKSATLDILNKLANMPIYVQFVGIGNGSSFRFLQKVAEDYNQAGFMHISDLSKTTDETLYEQLLNDEFITFLRTKHSHAIS
jgi:hypothetical protein